MTSPNWNECIDGSGRRGNSPAFDTLKLPPPGQARVDYVCANLLAISGFDFSNCQHLDNDWATWAAGMFFVLKGWEGEALRFDPQFDHKDVRGGHFLWSQWKIGIDFEKYALFRPEVVELTGKSAGLRDS